MILQPASRAASAPVGVTAGWKQHRETRAALSAAVALALWTGCSSVEGTTPAPNGQTRAQPRSLPTGSSYKTTKSDPASTAITTTADRARQEQAEVAPAPTPWGTGEARSFLVPAVDIVTFEILLNQYDRHFDSEDAYRSDASSINRNLSRGWVIDDDPFATNQLLHPYQGSLYHGFSRSAGLDYWESLAYDFAGSALWEVAGETVPPSLNDQITTTFGGSFLGEALFRIASFTLEDDSHDPGIVRRLFAGLVSPATGVNRLAYGGRFDGVFPSNKPATFASAGFGVRRNERISDANGLADLKQDEVAAAVVMDYGLPGKPGYEYDRPFDYFHFELTAVSSTSALPEDLMVRGLLYGRKFELSRNGHGIWGLYGGYDYISPEVFSVSSTSLSVGTTDQWKVADALRLQATLLAGVGWTAAGTIADAEVDRAYHYGLSPQGLVAFRFLFGETAALDLTGRNYYVGAFRSDASENSETILRGRVALTVRISGHNCLGIEYVASSRDATYEDGIDTYQSIGAISLLYTVVSGTTFGAVGL